jgi:hypothetical protein
MPNDYEVLKEFALKRVDELQKELGETLWVSFFHT